MTLEEFLQQNFLLREPGSGTRELLDQALAVLGYAVEPLWESCSTQALIHGVKKGLGISVLPYLMGTAGTAGRRAFVASGRSTFSAAVFFGCISSK